MLTSATDSVTVAQTAAPEATVSTAARRRPKEQASAAKPVPEATGSRASANGTPSTAPAKDAASNAPTGNTPPQYRLVYDEEFSRTFVQIVDRTSGEEILRFPPEELVKFIDNSIGRSNGGGTSGLFLDRSV